MNALILGVGPPQRDAIDYLKSQRHTVHALSYQPEPVGSACADHFSIIDIKDKSAVERYSREHQIDLVYSVGSDIAMPTAAYVSKRRGLPFFVSESTNEVMRVKSLFRKFQTVHAAPSISYRILSQPEDAAGWDTFPAVIKPLDSQGQRGVFKVHSPQQIEAAFLRSAAYSNRHRAILEEYVAGEEFSANAYIVNNRMQFCFFSSRIAGIVTPFGMVSAHLLPVALEKTLHAKALARIEDTIEKLGIENGPVYVQFKIHQQDVFIIEMAPRLDGCHLWRAIYLSTRINVLEMAFRHLMGENPTEQLRNGTPSQALRLEYFFQNPNTAFYRSNHSVDAGALFSQFYYRDDDRVTPVNGALEKVGYQIIPGATT